MSVFVEHHRSGQLLVSSRDQAATIVITGEDSNSEAELLVST